MNKLGIGWDRGSRNENWRNSYTRGDRRESRPFSFSFSATAVSSAVKLFFSGTISMLLLFFLNSSALAISGRDVYEKVHDLRSRTLDHKIEMTMILFDKGGGKR